MRRSSVVTPCTRFRGTENATLAPEAWVSLICLLPLVTRLLGLGLKGLVDLVGELVEEGVQFRSLTNGIDTTTPHGRFFFHMMASLAQMERELIAERTKAGLDAARKRGRMVGRKRRMTPGKIESAQQLLGGGMAPREVAKNLGVSIPTLYRWVPASSR
jgi:DNA invertase Pin-like site-specific DNA recombinase